MCWATAVKRTVSSWVGLIRTEPRPPQTCPSLMFLPPSEETIDRPSEGSQRRVESEERQEWIDQRCRCPRGIDPARVLAVETGSAESGDVAERHVDEATEIIARSAAIDELETCASAAAEFAELRRVGDELEHAAERARTVESALRTAQHLEAGHVERVEIARERRHR